jgi:MFS family permease
MRIVASFLSMAAPLASASTYYVAPSGNDGNPGTLAQPWRTLQHAADRVGPGDTVEVRAGNYAGMYLETSGTSAQPIVFEAYANESPSITADNPNTPDGVNLEGASYVTVQGFTVNGRTRAGIRAVLCEHVTIRGNTMDRNGVWGVLTGFCDDLLIEGNVASHSVQQHGIYVGNSGDRPVIRGNVIWGNNDNGIHMNGDVSQGGDGIISDALVEDNVIYDNGAGGGSGINCDGVQDSLIRNNLIYDEHSSGISLYQIDGGGPSSGNRLLNNTVLIASNGRWALNIHDGATNTAARNNILYNAHSFRGSVDIGSDSLPGFASDYNAVMDRFTTDGGDSILTLAQWRQQTGLDAHSFVATPAQLFANAAGDDYRLSATSPAIDAGETRADVPADIVGYARPQGANPRASAEARSAATGADGPVCGSRCSYNALDNGISARRRQSARPPLTTATEPAARPLTRRDAKTLVLAALGGALEYYDFIIFVFFTSVIGQLFFPPETPDWLRQLQAFGLFAAGYLARPLGGIVMAHFGDRSGRKRMFTLSVFLMAIPTLLIGLLPTYATLGYAAPLALLVLRILQGAAVGGEVPGAWTFVAEHVPERRVGFACGTLTSGLTVGIVLGSLIATWVNSTWSADEVQAFAWRIPFLVGGVFGFLAVFLRRLLAETPVFEEMRRRQELVEGLPLRVVLAGHGRAVLVSMLLTWVLTAGIVVVILMTPTLIQKLFGIAAAQTLAANSLATVGLSIGCIVFGLLADRFGAERMLMLGCAALLVATYVLYFGLARGPEHLDSLYAAAGFCVGVVGVIPTILVRAFPAPVRFSGISFAYNIAYAIFGGLTPLLVTLLMKDQPFAPAHYVAALCGLGIATAAWVAASASAPSRTASTAA